MVSAGTDKSSLTLSVVSHGQGHLVRNLLGDLRRASDVSFDILLTLNIPEDESFLSEFSELPITVIRNPTVKGFGANHNAAFRAARGHHFAIVNPDIRTETLRLQPLIDALAGTRTGACGPVVLSSEALVADSARRFPTTGRLGRRVLLGQREPDYAWTDLPIEVDWLAGMFVVFQRQAFAEVGGFDERFFMYFEDADICRRLHLNGWSVKLVPKTIVVHDAQRSSHRSMQHLRWHLRSAIRYLLGC